MGLGGKRQTAPKRPISIVDLPKKNGERTRLQAFFKRPSQVAIAVCLKHNEPVGVEP